MRCARVAALLLFAVVPGGGDDQRGLELLGQGKYAEAAAAFRAAIDAEGPSAERSYNLALALWRAGELDEAEAAAEQTATLSDGRLNALRDGLLGNLRYTAAKAAEAEDLRAALGLAEQARSHYLRGAVAPGARAELARNLERAQRLIEELEEKIKEQEEQQEEQQDGDEDQQDDQQEGEEGDDQGDGANEPSSEPQDEPGEQGEDQDQSEAGSDQQQEQQPAPGEQSAGRELTPEEKKRLLDKLDELEQMRVELREKQKAKRPKVRRDW